MPACDYTQTFTSTAESNKITPTVSANTISYSIHSNDVLDAGFKTVTVVSTLNNIPSSTSQSTFLVNIIDPCLSTNISITPNEVENLVQFANWTTQTKSKYTFEDRVSKSINAAPDFCGDKLIDFKLNGTTTTYFSVDNSDYIYFSPPIDTKDFGTGVATVQVSMKKYPLVKSTTM